MSDFDLGSPQLLALSNGQAIDAFGFLGPHMDSGVPVGAASTLIGSLK